MKLTDSGVLKINCILRACKLTSTLGNFCNAYYTGNELLKKL